VQDKMSEETNKLLEWFVNGLKKYGLLVFLGVVLYQMVKRSWFWIIMPILFLVTLRQVAVIANIAWVDKVSVFGLVVTWIFTLSMLKKLASCFVKEVKDA